MYPTDLYARYNMRIAIVDPQNVIDRQMDRKTLPDRLMDAIHDEAARINESICSRKPNI